MTVRSFLLVLHRWAGLAMAAFLIVVGVTGSLLAFYAELDHWLAPRLHPGPHAGVELDAATLARRAEALVPRARANTVYLGEKGVASIGMEPRPGAPPLDFSTLVLDVATGEELGRLDWGAPPASRAAIMPFVYALHYQLAAGSLGTYILGVVALVWTIDCFVAFYLTLPSPGVRARKSFLARWKPAWLVKSPSSAYRVNFDLHRASGLWLWAFLLIFAVSSVFWNLNDIYSRAISLFLDYESPGWARSAAFAPERDARPLEWEEAQRIGRALMEEKAREHGFTIERPLALYILTSSGYAEYRVRSSRDIGDKGGATSVYFDAYTGALRSEAIPTGQRAGNTLTTWLAELHTANLFGLPYRILVCALGLVITVLSITGVYIWWKKRRARKGHRSSLRLRKERREAVVERRARSQNGALTSALVFEPGRPDTTDRLP